ncbi:MAG: hypothetical protein R2911_19480 [Caldilineaceae bacterium]
MIRGWARAENEIVATKELQVRPLLPRFFTAGDRLPALPCSISPVRI